jgi:hypothetical protein
LTPRRSYEVLEFAGDDSGLIRFDPLLESDGEDVELRDRDKGLEYLASASRQLQIEERDVNQELNAVEQDPDVNQGVL